jgi:hypothetical protein
MNRILRTARLSVPVSAFVVVMGCGPTTELEVGGGTISAGPWSASVSDHGRDLSVCLEIRPSRRDLDRLCGLDGSNAGLW